MSPKAWWIVALLLLGPWHTYQLYREGSWGRPPLPHGDGPDYESLAYSLSIGEGFQFSWQSPEWQSPYIHDGGAYTQLQRRDWPGPTTSRPPLYPTVIATIYRVLPRGPTAFAAIRVLSAWMTAVAGALAVAMAFGIANQFAQFATRTSSTSWVPNIAALSTLGLAFLDRTIRTYSTDFLTEPMALLLTTCLVGCGLQLVRHGHGLGWLSMLALCTGLLVLTRSITVFWLPGLTVLVACSVRGYRLKYASLYLAITLLIVSPWWVRNCMVLDRWMPLGGQGAASLRGGYSDEALSDDGNWHGDAEIRIQRQLEQVEGAGDWTQAQREVALADHANRETQSWVWEHIRELPRLVGMRVRTHWGPYSGTSLMWRIAMVLGAIALLAQRRPESIWLIGLPVVNTLGVACLYETGGRFLVPLYACLYVLAGLGVAWSLQQIWDLQFRSKGL